MKGIKIELFGIATILLGIAVTTNRKEGWTLRNLDSNVIYISSFASMALHPGRSRSLAIPCFTKGEVYLYAASKLANTKSASEMACRHMMTSQFRSERGKTRKREISRDFSRFFDPAFFRSFIDPFCPFRCCVRTRTHEKGLNLIVISLLRAFLARRYSFPS